MTSSPDVPATSGIEPFSAETRLALARAGEGQAAANGIVKGYSIGALSVGLLPFPVLDALVLMDLQMNLAAHLADHYGVPFRAVYRRTVVALLAGSLPVVATGVGLSMLKVVPVFGSLGGGATLSTLAGAVTYAHGRVLTEHFEAGGTFDDLSWSVLKPRLRAELAKGAQPSLAAG